ncbi:MAG: RNA polymerase sigma factor RpoD/SigA [Fibromonadaceae bacterium]|nr:RNA polymerase sigma factor RpoD/SigA [Fibromonadaceae bacterium]
MTTPVESLYFKDLNQYQTLTNQEERALILILRDDNKKSIHNAALRKLICSNLRFVVSVARKYQGRGLSLLDLINEGNLGLFRAALRYDCRKDVRFISYAVWWIRQAIQKAIFEKVGTMRIPPNKITLVNRFKKALSNNMGDYEKTFSIPEFKDNEKDIIDIMEKMMEISLDSPANDDPSSDGIGTLLDVLEGDADHREDVIRNSELTVLINEVLSKLPKREGDIIRMFYGIDAAEDSTLRNIGEDMQLSREKVRQIKNKAIRRMQKNKEFYENLKEFYS